MLFDVTRCKPSRWGVPLLSLAVVVVVGVNMSSARAQDVQEDAPQDAQPASEKPLTSADARATGEAGSFPTPDIATDAWQIGLEAEIPRAIFVPDHQGNPRWYWYLAYTVTNETGQDRLFIPEVAVVTDGGRIIEAGRGVPARAYSVIAGQLHNPLMESPQEIIGTLRQGEDFARQSVAIWPIPAEDVDQFTVFFAGLSGESAKLLRPSTGEPLLEPAADPETGEPMLDTDGQPVMREVIARRTTALTYATPGTPATPQNQPISLLDEGQVMR